MKKILLVIFTIIICSISSIHAESDIQLGLGAPVFHYPENASLLTININNHNFFGEKENIGFSEYVSFSPITTDLFTQFPGFNFSAFVGPSFRFSLSEGQDFIISTGFKYFFNFKRNVDIYPNNTLEESERSLTVVGTKIFSAYTFSLDMQFKFFSDKLFSLALGMPASIGFGSVNYQEEVNSSNPNSVYKTLASNSKMEEFFEFGCPYLMISINF